MFLAFSLLLVGWQACYAVHRDANPHPTHRDDYEIHQDAHPHPTHHNDYTIHPNTHPHPTHHDDYAKHPNTHPHPTHHDDYAKHPNTHPHPTHHDDYAIHKNTHPHPTHHDDYAVHRDAHPHPTHRDDYAHRNVHFPKGFSFGVSSSAYQIEGAWNGDGKGENIWDRFLHTHPHYANGTNGDIAADAYYKWEGDVKLLKDLNVGHYKLSLSWSSILPNGLISNVNQAAVDHYRKQFKLLRKYKIEPFVTLYHWDLPQHLQDRGGFLNKSIVSWFEDYAKLSFELFGHEVKYWSTFNEPYEICANGYGSSLLAPAINKSGVADYICGHNLLKAHAAAWRVYDKEFRKDQGGRVSINLGFEWVEPASDSKEDKFAAQIQRQFSVGWFAHPIYIGDYPKVLKDRVKKLSELQGLKKSRLPEFSSKDIEFIRGTHDYFSLNSNHIILAEAQNCTLFPIRLQSDVGTKLRLKKGNHTYGIRKSLGWIKKEYNNPSIIITENGYPSRSATLEDWDRITYIKKTLVNVYDAIKVDGVRVYGYTYRSFLDGFEWNRGYSVKYGLYAVNFKDHKRPRTPRKSAFWYKRLASTGCTGEKFQHREKH